MPWPSAVGSLVVYCCLKRNNFRSFRIIDLAKNSRQIFEFKGLIRKIFRNKDLARVLPFSGRWLFCGAGKRRGRRRWAGSRLFCLRLFCQRSNSRYGKHFVCYKSILTFGVKLFVGSFPPFDQLH